MTMDRVFPEPTTVSGEGFTLRPWQPTDVALLAPFVDEALTVQWAPLLRGDEGLVEWVAKREVWDSHLSWAIVDDLANLLGAIALFEIELAHAHAQLGYWVAPTSRGRGLAGRAARLAAEFAFEALPLERIALFHAVENEASCRAALKAGFTPEGIARKSWRYPDGALHDEHLHALLREDLGQPH